MPRFKKGRLGVEAAFFLYTTPHPRYTNLHMNKQKLQVYFLLAALVGSAIISFFIFKPFVYALILAVVVATICAPIHDRILARMKQRDGMAAVISTLLVLIIVIIPLSLLGTQIFKEASSVYIYLTSDEGSHIIASSTNHTLDVLRQTFPALRDVTINVNQYARDFLSWLLPYWGSLFSNILKILMSTFIFLLALYYLFKDGIKLRSSVTLISPLEDKYDALIFAKVGRAINSVVKGNLIVAMIQGALTCIGFLIFGVPSAVLWGSVAAVTAIIPGFGTAIVVIPALVYLFLSGHTIAFVGLLIWGVVAVGLVDNILGPHLVEKGIQIHPFLILLSVLGGLALFGPLGFLMGPIILSLLFTLAQIYSDIVNKENI